ncbi:uncharacterized protein LOC105188830 [Harpegnathos saltator]|uniref:uncharacterized protein LOC105188830 n=1 Tax=Harpegnathos saltator TaxID=610380 RepID=UPI000DBEE734|nr:uncharacterized protein LOC105188830 [Harpegnathos saltator]
MYITDRSWQSVTSESSSAVSIIASYSKSTFAEKMRSCTFVFVALVAALLCAAEYARAKEICAQENCLTPNKCDEQVKSDILCPEQGTSCCSIVKKEYQTHCRHFGGICMDKCAIMLQHQVVDCPNNQVCCTLV